jgi:hypothetical protein
MIFFFGIGSSLKDLIPQIKNFWPRRKLHIDAYEVSVVDDFTIEVVSKIRQQFS